MIVQPLPWLELRELIGLHNQAKYIFDTEDPDSPRIAEALSIYEWRIPALLDRLVELLPTPTYIIPVGEFSAWHVADTGEPLLEVQLMAEGDVILTTLRDRDWLKDQLENCALHPFGTDV